MKTKCFLLILLLSFSFQQLLGQANRNGQYMGVPCGKAPTLANPANYIQYIPKKTPNTNTNTNYPNNNNYFQYKNGTSYHNEVSRYLAEYEKEINNQSDQIEFYNYRLQFESQKEIEYEILNNQFFKINKASWNSYYVNSKEEKYIDIRELKNLLSAQTILVKNYIELNQTPMITKEESNKIFYNLKDIDFPEYLTINEVYHISLEFTGLTNDFYPTILPIYLYYQG
jgi:hypothetical protein